MSTALRTNRENSALIYLLFSINEFFRKFYKCVRKYHRMDRLIFKTWNTKTCWSNRINCSKEKKMKKIAPLILNLNEHFLSYIQIYFNQTVHHGLNKIIYIHIYFNNKLWIKWMKLPIPCIEENQKKIIKVVYFVYISHGWSYERVFLNACFPNTHSHLYTHLDICVYKRSHPWMNKRIINGEKI